MRTGSLVYKKFGFYNIRV